MIVHAACMLHVVYKQQTLHGRVLCHVELATAGLLNSEGYLAFVIRSANCHMHCTD